ncbi:MAG: hypothetical protein MO852_11990, partial [Candidatus Devosia euplotis]|nr:hypothetical protein [Candidatus Devosia euplotis]
ENVRSEEDEPVGDEIAAMAVVVDAFGAHSGRRQAARVCAGGHGAAAASSHFAELNRISKALFQDTVKPVRDRYENTTQRDG